MFFFSTNGSGTTGFLHAKECSWNIGLKLLEGTIGTNLHYLGLDNGFSNMTPKAQANNNKDKLDFIKLKNFVLKKIVLQITSSKTLKTTHRIGEKFCKSYSW